MFHDAERRPPELDVKHASALLMEDSLDERRQGRPARARAARPPEPPRAARRTARGTRPRAAPGRRTASTRGAGSRPARSPPTTTSRRARAEELLTIVAGELVSPQTLDGYFEAVERLRAATGEQALRRGDDATRSRTRSHDADDPHELLAVTFSIWAKAPERHRPDPARRRARATPPARTAATTTRSARTSARAARPSGTSSPRATRARGSVAIPRTPPLARAMIS